MEATVKKTVEYNLVMNEEEAEWLKNIVQNPLHDNETDRDTEMRRKIWIALGGPV